jgi:FkbM family methyltransferase
VHNYLASVREIKAQLTQFGFSTILTPMEVYPHLSRELGWRFWLGSRQDYAAAVSPIEQLGALWADQESERLFYETLLYRLGIELEVVAPLTDVLFQYAVPAIPRWQAPLRMVDGGAYTGDTLQNLLQHGYHFATIHAFEPDAENFKRLCVTASAFTPETQISLWPCGLWSSTCRMNFSEGFEMGSKLSDAGPTMVPVVALDDVLHGQPVNLIKLDIEGAEADALRGAQRLIKKYRPGLAICLYHYPQHLWSIPLWVEGLNLDYHFYCRTHAHNTFDTVLYAIPE